MRRLFTFLTAAAVLTAMLLPSCSPAEDEETRRHREVRTAAEGYYNLLLSRQDSQYVAGLSGAARMSDELRIQLQDAAAQFGERLRRTGGGVAGVRAMRDSLWNDSALVFLEITFADSTRETTLLPMVFEDGVWRMQ